MSKEWKIGIAAALVVLSLLFWFWRCRWICRVLVWYAKGRSRSVGYKIPLGLDIKGGVQITLEAVPYENQTLTQNDVNQLKRF